MRKTLLVLLFSLVAMHCGAQNASGWFCPGCGMSDNNGKFCHTCGHQKPVDGVLFFDDMQSSEPGDKWYVPELRDVENSGPGVDGTFKTEYFGQPVAIYETRQGSKVISSTKEKCKDTWTRISWDAFHEHSSEVTTVNEMEISGSLRPAIDGHPIFLPDRFSFEFDIYLFAPDSGTRKDDNEDFCRIYFCGHSFYINTWARDLYSPYFVGGDSLIPFPVTKSGWRHFKFRFIGQNDDSVVLLVDGNIIGSTSHTPYPRKDGDNHLEFHSGTNLKYFCIKNVRVTDESGD